MAARSAPNRNNAPSVGRRRRRLRLTIAALVAGTVLATLVGAWTYRSLRPETYRPGEDIAELTAALAKNLPENAPVPRFRDVTAEAGLGAFRSFVGTRSSQLPEDMGSGAAWGDFDDDGDEDLAIVASGGPLTAAPGERAATLLYENMGDGTFRRSDALPEVRIVGMGAAWGDYDGDGRLDLVVTGYRSLLLFRNDRGRLETVSGLGERDGFWAGAAWGDYDNDRDLDLYVCGYVQYEESDADRARVSQQYGKAVPYTLNPASYTAAVNLLFRNDGDGAFTEIAETLGVHNPRGRSLGALWHDFDDDGWLDLYVANDISDNVLYHNRGGRFEEISHAAWVADYRGAMGLAAGDWNRDGDDDLFVSHWIAQENALYDSLLADRASSGGTAAPVQFVDVADQRGLGQIALRLIGWGSEFFDLDHDGWLDLAVANGSTFESDDVPGTLVPQSSFLFWNDAGRHFHDLAPLDEALSRPHVSRGLAVADYDLDGDVDVLWVDHGEGVRLLRNDTASGNWIQLDLRARTASGEVGPADGARVVARVGDTVLRRTVSSASYLSQSSRIVHLGLGGADRVDRLEVRWPGGGDTQTFEDLAAGTRWTLVEDEPEARRRDLPGVRADSAPTAATESERARIVEFWARQRAAMDAMKIEGDAAAAIPLFRAALELNPDHEDSLYYLANCLEAEGDREGALAALEELVRVNPQSHRGFKQLGILRAFGAGPAEDLERASAALERALELNPEETGALLVLGEIALIRGDHATAVRRLEWATRTNPQAAGGFFLRGYVAWKEGDPERARAMLAEVRRALGPEWTPAGMTSEGDVRAAMHVDPTPLSRYWQAWDGSEEPARAYAALDDHLAGGP